MKRALSAILIGVIVVLFVVTTLGGITCVSIILVLRRRKSLNTNNTTESKRSTPEYYEIQETDVSREYESIEDYMNTSSTPMESHENENNINLIQNQAYASLQHPPQ